MNFDLSPEQRAVQSVVSALLTAECSERRTLEDYEKGAEHDSLWRQLAGLGLGGVVIPETYGGAGLELLDLAVVCESLGRHAAPAPLIEHALAGYAILLAGSEAQKQRWLPAISSCAMRATIAFAEGEDGWLPEDWTVEAGKQLNGVKAYVPFALGADLIVVGLRGGRFGVVEAGASGLIIDSAQSFDPSRRLSTMRLNNTPVEILSGVDCAARVLDAALVLIAADAFGGGSRCVSAITEYAKERVQFGVPIGQFQAVKHQLADMALEIEPSVGLYWFAAHAFDHDPTAAPLVAALAKAHITEAYARVTRSMIELYGGIGYTWEHGGHIWLKRAVYDKVVFGAPERHYKRAADLAGW